jgi:threonyl-tRNA synthetase
MERFIALLIENNGGNFPVWLAPNKVTILPISSKYIPYCQQIANEINETLDLQIEVDEREEKIGRKIRDAEIQKTPYMLIVGEIESAENKVSIRKHGEGDKGMILVSEFIATLKNEIKI